MGLAINPPNQLMARRFKEPVDTPTGSLREVDTWMRVETKLADFPPLVEPAVGEEEEEEEL